MIAFMTNEQYNLVKKQVNKIINAKSSVNDPTILKTVKTLAWEVVQQSLPDMAEEEASLLGQMRLVDDRLTADKFFHELKPYVIPFPALSETKLRKLFPKVKKLKFPLIDAEDYQTMTYLSWDEKGSQYRMIVAPYEQSYIGLRGTFQPSEQKGLCHICHRFTDIGMFIVETKGEVVGTFTKRGNTVCKDMKDCNHHVETLLHLSKFIRHITGK